MNIRKQSLRYLAEKGFNMEIPLPEIEPFQLPAGEKVARRIVELCALIGLSVPEVDQDKLLYWLKENKLYQGMQESDKRFFKIGKRNLKEQEVIDLEWMRESLFTLCWAMSIEKNMPFPSEESFDESVLERIPPAVAVQPFIKSGVLRKKHEIMQQVDIHYCLHWIIKSHKSYRNSINESVIIERRRALEWLICDDDWWEISLDT